MWNKNELKPVGSCVLTLRNPKTKKKYKVSFVVVKEDLVPIIGKIVSEKMGLITVNYVATIKQKSRPEDRFPEVFNDDEIGTLTGGPVRLVCDETVPLKVMPARREPIALKEKVDSALTKLCKADVIEKVDVPTNWVN